MNILAGHHAHDTNICYLQDGEVKYWNKLERLSKIKRNGHPPELILLYEEVRDNIDLSTLDYTILGTPWNKVDNINDPVAGYWEQFFPNNFIRFNNHHLSHASNAFYGSGYDKSYALVIDRNGSFDKSTRDGEQITPTGCQTETLYLCEYPNKFKVIFSNTCWVGITGKYGLISEKCGINDLDNGKTMGLAAYGNDGVEIEYKLTNKNIAIKDDEMRKLVTTDKKFRNDFLIDMSNQYSPEDMANFIQRETNQDILNIVGNIDFDVCENLCYTGGHAHNCLTNFNIKQSLPKGVNFYVDPIPDDSACSIGYSKYTWYAKTKSMEKYPMTNIFNCGA